MTQSIPFGPAAIRKPSSATLAGRVWQNSRSNRLSSPGARRGSGPEALGDDCSIESATPARANASVKAVITTREYIVHLGIRQIVRAPRSYSLLSVARYSIKNNRRARENGDITRRSPRFRPRFAQLHFRGKKTALE